MYWESGLLVKRIVVPVSAALVEVASSIPVGVAPLVLTTMIVGASVLGKEPSQSAPLIFTGMVLLYLKMLRGGPGFTGCRIPPPTMVKLTVRALKGSVPEPR